MDVADVAQMTEKDARRIALWIGLSGLATLALGILFLARPGSGIGILVGIFAAYCFLDGALMMTAAIAGVGPVGRGWLVVASLVSIAAGVVTLVRPGDAAVVILFVVAVRAILVGLDELYAAIRLGGLIASPWLLGVTGVLSIAFGVLLIRNPAAGLLSLAWLVGVYGVVVGVAQMGAAFAIGQAFKEGPRVMRPTAA